jgi:hypothetical protein
MNQNNTIPQELIAQCEAINKELLSHNAYIEPYRVEWDDEGWLRIKYISDNSLICNSLQPKQTDW